MADDDAGSWNRQTATRTVRIAAPFYQSSWFYGLCVLFGTLSAWGVYRTRERRLTGLFSAVLQERRRVAREMHDTIVQGIVGISTQLEALAMMLATSPSKARGQLDRIRELLRSNRDEARNALWDLRVETHESIDLATRLHDSVQQICAGVDLHVDLRLTHLVRPLPPEREYCLHRVAQEAVRNVVLHAQARQLSVDLAECAEGVRLVVKDDGIGVQASANRPHSMHLGLLGMRERVEQIGGRFVLTGGPGRSAELSVTVPRSANPGVLS